MITCCRNMSRGQNYGGNNNYGTMLAFDLIWLEWNRHVIADGSSSASHSGTFAIVSDPQWRMSHQKCHWRMDRCGDSLTSVSG